MEYVFTLALTCFSPPGEDITWHDFGQAKASAPIQRWVGDATRGAFLLLLGEKAESNQKLRIVSGVKNWPEASEGF
jgi:hypothetical protein